MCCPIRKKSKLEVAENLVQEVQISETLLKGKESLIESTAKCLNELDGIWCKFPDEMVTDDLMISLSESANEHLIKCTKLGSPWILRHTPQITDFFDIFEVLGSPGAYGVVRRGIHKQTGDEYAIKHINKMRYKSRKSQKIYFNDLRSEVYLMSQASDHPHIVSVHHVFEDVDTLYLVLDFCKGGELYDVLTTNREELNEVIAADLFRQMVSSIYYLHSLGIAHCDLKPENFVFKDKERKQLILIDFGMAKIIQFRKYFDSISGSPYYVAPEVLKNNYNEACDIWSLGICLFVMIFGYAPFFDRSDDPKQVYTKILQGFTPKIKKGYGAWFPDSQPVTAHCRDLIARMLRTNYADRLTGEEILEHPWLKIEVLSKNKELDDPSNNIQASAKLIQISNPAILNSLRFYRRKTNVLQDQVLALLGECNYLNANQRTSLKDFLEAADENKDNKISKKELFDALKQIDTDITMKDIESVFVTIDANNDGFLNYDELLSTRINRKLKSKESRLKKVFKSFDYNDDGKITKEELEAAWQSVQNEAPRKSYNFQQIIQEVDRDGDGMIDYEEFLSAFGKSRANSVNKDDNDKVNVVSVKL